MINIILHLFIDYFLVSDYISNLSVHENWLMGDSSSSSASGNNDTGKNASNLDSSKSADAALVSTALYAGIQVAKNVPNTAGKIGVIAGAGALGLGLVGGKNIISNITLEAGKYKNKFISSDDVMLLLDSIIGFTGNSGLDLLYLIQYFNCVSIYLIISMLYILFCVFTDENKIKNLLLKIKILPLFVVNYYLKIYNLIKKNGLILIVILLLLIIISNYLAFYYLGFYIENIDDIYKLYFK